MYIYIYIYISTIHIHMYIYIYIYIDTGSVMSTDVCFPFCGDGLRVDGRYSSSIPADNMCIYIYI